MDLRCLAHLGVVIPLLVKGYEGISHLICVALHFYIWGCPAVVALRAKSIFIENLSLIIYIVIWVLYEKKHYNPSCAFKMQY